MKLPIAILITASLVLVAVQTIETTQAQTPDSCLPAEELLGTVDQVLGETLQATSIHVPSNEVWLAPAGLSLVALTEVIVDGTLLVDGTNVAPGDLLITAPIVTINGIVATASGTDSLRLIGQPDGINNALASLPGEDGGDITILTNSLNLGPEACVATGNGGNGGDVVAATQFMSYLDANLLNADGQRVALNTCNLIDRLDTLEYLEIDFDLDCPEDPDELDIDALTERICGAMGKLVTSDSSAALNLQAAEVECLDGVDPDVDLDEWVTFAKALVDVVVGLANPDEIVSTVCDLTDSVYESNRNYNTYALVSGGSGGNGGSLNVASLGILASTFDVADSSSFYVGNGGTGGSVLSLGQGVAEDAAGTAGAGGASGNIFDHSFINHVTLDSGNGGNGGSANVQATNVRDCINYDIVPSTDELLDLVYGGLPPIDGVDGYSDTRAGLNACTSGSSGAPGADGSDGGSWGGAVGDDGGNGNAPTGTVGGATATGGAGTSGLRNGGNGGAASASGGSGCGGGAGGDGGNGGTYEDWGSCPGDCGKHGYNGVGGQGGTGGNGMSGADAFATGGAGGGCTYGRGGNGGDAGTQPGAGGSGGDGGNGGAGAPGGAGGNGGRGGAAGVQNPDRGAPGGGTAGCELGSFGSSSGGFRNSGSDGMTGYDGTDLPWKAYD